MENEETPTLLNPSQIAKRPLKQKFDFWDTQPMPKLTDDIPLGTNEPVDVPKTVAEVRQDPYPLHEQFEWSDVDVSEEKSMQEVYNLLYENYVEDDDNMFRFDYSIDFLKWALTPPGYRKEWHIGVRVKSNKKLVGFITGIPALIQIYHKELKMVEINFLCVHKKLRSKRLSPVLIKEVTRRVNLTDIWQATYTAGAVLPRPVASCGYFHRSLNPKKLIDVKFSYLGPRMTLARTIKLFRVPEKPQIPGIRAMEAKDVKAVFGLLSEFLKKYELAPVYTEEDITHWFLPRDGVINSYVVEDPETHEVTDFTSFYTLPSTIIGNAQYKTLKAAYSYYSVPNKHDLKALMNDAFVFAKQLDFDVYNCLNLMENEKVLKDLKFATGDGHLQYYVYNWKCPMLPPAKVGLVLL